MKRKHCLSLAPLILGGAILAAAPPAPATIIFQAGNQQYDVVNIQDANNVDSCVGDIDNTGFTMTFEDMIAPDGSGTVTMHCAHGAATVESYLDGLPGSTATGFSSITLVAQSGTAWTAGDFSLDQINKTPAGFVTFNGIDQFGNPTSTQLPIDWTGQNPYNFTTADGELVTSIVISVNTASPLRDIKQVSLNAVPMPEPGTLVLLGAGLVAVAVFPLRAGARPNAV